MAALALGGTSLGNALQQILMAEDIQPGDSPSYQMCKTLMSYHPLGAKMTDTPIMMAQSQRRRIVVPDGPEDELKEAFDREWEAIGADRHIFNCGRLARCYGVASVALLGEGTPPNRDVNFKELYHSKIGFNVLDPLNTAGSLVLDQNPNSIDFQKVPGIAVGGVAYHRSRTVTIMNEEPLYIEYTSSAFGFVGRSVYQRALYMLKSYIQTLLTDDLISLKAGLLIAKQKGPGSVIDNVMAWVAGQKREMLQQGMVGGVLSIDVEEAIETLNLQNLDGAYSLGRKNIIDNIATAADMPALVLNQETMASGFADGTEDAKRVTQFVDRIRIWLQPLYAFFDQIVMYRAWNPDWYTTIQKKYPEQWGRVPYNAAFYRFKNSFKAEWPNLIEEPDSEKIKVQDVKLKAIIALVEVLAPLVTDPHNRAALIQWAAENFNEIEMMFTSPLVLDFEQLEEGLEDAAEQQKIMQAAAAEKEPDEPKPFASTDSESSDRIARSMGGLTAAVAALPDLKARRDEIRRRVLANA